MIELTTIEVIGPPGINMDCKTRLVKVKVAHKYIQSMIQYSDHTEIQLYGTSIDVKETIEEIETIIRRSE